MPLEEVEALNGKPFKLRDFNTDVATQVGSPLGKAERWSASPGRCRFSVRFEPDDDAPSATF
jgi:hypothetical protein